MIELNSNKKVTELSNEDLRKEIITLQTSLISTEHRLGMQLEILERELSKYKRALKIIVDTNEEIELENKNELNEKKELKG